MANQKAKHYYVKTNDLVFGKTKRGKNGENKGREKFVEYTHEITGRKILRCKSHDDVRSGLLVDVKHGLSKTSIYIIWRSMMSRCYRKTDKSYKDYGARGIKVCDQWHDPEVFVFDNTEYAPGLTLDRIDYDGNYSKENCRWISMSAQQRNKRNNVWITIGNVKQTLTDWCEQNDIKPSTAIARISKCGWEPAIAVTTKVK